MYYFYRLKDCREDKDLSQSEIAKILGIDQRVYSNYETGKRKIPINHLITLAIFYKTSLDYIVGLTNEIAPPKRVNNIQNLTNLTIEKQWKKLTIYRTMCWWCISDKIKSIRDFKRERENKLLALQTNGYELSEFYENA